MSKSNRNLICEELNLFKIFSSYYSALPWYNWFKELHNSMLRVFIFQWYETIDKLLSVCDSSHAQHVWPKEVFSYTKQFKKFINKNINFIWIEGKQCQFK